MNRGEVLSARMWNHVQKSHFAVMAQWHNSVSACYTEAQGDSGCSFPWVSLTSSRQMACCVLARKIDNYLSKWLAN
jgi:hypothetical protein